MEKDQQFLKDKIRKCYLDVLKREPDEIGLSHYLKLMESNEINEKKLVDILKNSEECIGYKKVKKIEENFDYGKKLDELKIVAMYRIQNEERWIKQSLKYTSEICKEIVILDDCSTDNTLKICKQFSNVIDIYERKESMELDEVRDKNILLKMALKRNPNFILLLDGDEIIMPNSKDVLLKEICFQYPQEKIFAFQYYTMWEKPNQYRWDGDNKMSWQSKLMRIEDNNQSLQFSESGYPGNAHSIHVPCTTELPVRSQVKILHYGNYDRELRRRKYEYFHQVDPGGKDFNGYENIIDADSNSDILETKTLPKKSYVEDII